VTEVDSPVVPSARPVIEIPIQAARRLAIEAQGLGENGADPSPGGVLQLVKHMGCVQLDPISVVAPSHLLVLWSRLGTFDVRILEDLLWNERRLFHYFAHAASIVPTDDYPIHSYSMRRWGKGDSGWDRRVRLWLEENRGLQRSILRQLRARGPLRTRDFAATPNAAWRSTGWTNDRSVGRMLDFLCVKGRVMIAGRQGLERIWELADRWFPEWTPRESWSRRRVVEEATRRSLSALGVATPQQIKQHFTRGTYPGLPDVLAGFERRGEVARITVVDGDRPLRGTWYVSAHDLPRVEKLARADWVGGARLLSPFDNLICDRARTQELWNFEYRIEIYVPRAKRAYGYYVLPILWHDQLVGRADLAVDRNAGTLAVQSLHAEPDAPAEAAAGVGQALLSLTEFVGADRVRFASPPPQQWAKELS
jgi:uncharacterized protein YcaQ